MERMPVRPVQVKMAFCVAMLTVLLKGLKRISRLANTDFI